MRIAIVGPPNAGKSSLLNLLAGHDAAIVSPVAGTTRDLVQVQLELGGNKVRSLLVSVHQLNQWVEVKTHPSLRLGWLAGTLAGCRGLACTRDLHTLPAARGVTGLAWRVRSLARHARFAAGHPHRQRGPAPDRLPH